MIIYCNLRCNQENNKKIYEVVRFATCKNMFQYKYNHIISKVKCNIELLCSISNTYLLGPFLKHSAAPNLISEFHNIFFILYKKNKLVFLKNFCEY